MENFSTIHLREENIDIIVKNSYNKPEIMNDTRKKWQELINLISEILEVPASLIMQMTTENMEVFLTSRGSDNPYPPDGKDSLGHGLYCETVIGRNSMLEVEDALNDKNWKDNPDVKLNMISYLGFPVKWPDGSFFGTICSLDNKPRKYSSTYKELMNTFRKILEMDLKKEYDLMQLKKENRLLDYSIREIHHRIKNNFNIILNFIQLKSLVKENSRGQLLKEIENRIQAVSLLHEKLYKSISFTPSTDSYITELCHIVISNLTESKIRLSIEIDEIYLSNRLLDYGVVLVELITNSIKYAFNNIKEPEIRIELKVNDKSLFFKYSDNGKGVDDNFETGFGSLLFQAFAEKNGGTFNILGEPRNNFIFNLTPPQYLKSY